MDTAARQRTMAQWAITAGVILVMTALSLTFLADRAVRARQAELSAHTQVIDSLTAERDRAATDEARQAIDAELGRRGPYRASAQYHVSGAIGARSALWRWSGLGPILSLVGLTLAVAGIVTRRRYRE